MSPTFGWHYDFEDVFIAQTLGTKDYYFRDNTVGRHTRLGERLDFSALRAERTPSRRPSCGPATGCTSRLDGGIS